MTPAQLTRLVQWLDQAGISAFELAQPGYAVRLRLHGAVALAAGGPGAGSAARTTRPVLAPVQGIFRAAHPLRAGPLAEPGREVAAGAILGLVQVDGLIYRPVLAAQPGRVSRQWAADGAAVTAGMPLFELTSGGDPIQISEATT